MSLITVSLIISRYPGLGGYNYPRIIAPPNDVLKIEKTGIWNAAINNAFFLQAVIFLLIIRPYFPQYGSLMIKCCTEF